MNRKDFLLEIGVEEIPAGYIAAAMQTLQKYFSELLQAKKLDYEKIELFSTPRRFAIRIEGVETKQKDETIERVGPTREIAYDKDGNLTKAAAGFLRSAKATESDIFFVSDKKGEKLAVRLKISGQETYDILKNAIPPLFKKFNFPKTMHWEMDNISFARPIRWIVALWDQAIITCRISQLAAKNISYGNRFQKLDNSVEILSPKTYEHTLQQVAVIANRQKRYQRIEQQLDKIFASSDLAIVPDKNLLETVTDLVEFPTAVIGEFSQNYLNLPQKIITSTLSQHQKYFSVQDSAGNLANKFVFISNGNPENSELIRRGNEKVIAARLDDATFFYREDSAKPLEEYVPKLAEVMFQAKLGSLLDKTERITALSKFISARLQLEAATTAKILRAAQLCKADLVTLMLGEKEFTKLQGYMGQKYALASGEDEEVAKAIYQHYQPRGKNDALPGSTIGSVVAIADKLDTVCGIFGADMIPSGSNDPFALRRAANGVVQIISQKQLKLDLLELIEKAYELLETKLQPAGNNKAAVQDFFRQRVKWLLQSQNIETDVIDSVINIDFSDIADLKQRADDLQEFKQQESFHRLVIGFKRVSNIIAKEQKDYNFDPQLLNEKYEQELFSGYQKLQPAIEVELQEKNYRKVLELLVDFGKTIDLFFDHVMVNAEAENLRQNRYALLTKIQKLFFQVADLNKIVIQ
jgi:glycyl-tRNA synthetase beta chain